jgi:hypothetical protein
LEDFTMNKSRAGIDWVAAMQDYITSDASHRDIAAKFGCHRKAVERRSAIDGWSAARDRFRDSVGRRAQALQSESRAHRLKDWNDNDLNIAKALRSQTAKAFTRMVKEGNGTIDLNTLRNVASVIESTQRIGRLALGATTDNQGMIGDPTEDGVAAPRLGDFYASVKFEGPTKGAAPVPSETPPEDDEPTKH